MAPRSLVAPRTRRGRHAAREAALRILYEADMSDRDAVELFAARRSELKLDEQANEYAASLVERVAARRDELDAAGIVREGSAVQSSLQRGHLRRLGRYMYHAGLVGSDSAAGPRHRRHGCVVWVQSRWRA